MEVFRRGFVDAECFLDEGDDHPQVIDGFVDRDHGLFNPVRPHTAILAVRTKTKPVCKFVN